MSTGVPRIPCSLNRQPRGPETEIPWPRIPKETSAPGRQAAHIRIRARGLMLSLPSRRHQRLFSQEDVDAQGVPEKDSGHLLSLKQLHFYH